MQVGSDLSVGFGAQPRFRPLEHPNQENQAGRRGCRMEESGSSHRRAQRKRSELDCAKTEARKGRNSSVGPDIGRSEGTGANYARGTACRCESAITPFRETWSLRTQGPGAGKGRTDRYTRMIEKDQRGLDDEKARKRLTDKANWPRLHRDDERSRGSGEQRKSGRQCRRGPS